MIDGQIAIDGHCHIGSFGTQKNGVRCFTAQDLIMRMDRNGIERTVVCHLISPLSRAEDFPTANDLVLTAMASYPKRLAGVCVVNPRYGVTAFAEAERCLAAGMRGIKVHPVIHGSYPIDGALMDPLMEIAGEAGVPLVTHSDFNARSCTPYQVARLAARHPRVTIVMLHMGMDTDMIAHTPEIAKPYRNIILDTSCTPDLPYPVFVNSVRHVGSDRVQFGSDGPVCSIEVNLTKLQVAKLAYGLSRDDASNILGGTAARIFSIDGTG